MNSKFLLAVLAATIIAFFGGSLIWGVLLENYYAANSTDAAKALLRSEEDMVMWAMIVGNLLWATVIVWVLDKTGSRSAATGAVTAAILIGFFSLSMNMFFYSMMDMHTGLGVLFVDAIVSTLFGGVIGGVAGWILGRGGDNATME